MCLYFCPTPKPGNEEADTTLASILPNEPVDVLEPLTLVTSSRAVIPAIEVAITLPNEPVETDEPLTPPPTNVMLLELSSPRNEPEIVLSVLLLARFVATSAAILADKLVNEPVIVVALRAVVPAMSAAILAETDVNEPEIVALLRV